MSRRRRGIEIVKDILIVLLTLSAGALIYLSPLVQGSGLLESLPRRGGESAGGAVSPQSLSAAAIPLRMTAGTELGLYGAQYDQAAVDALFDAAAPLLGEALAAAGEPSPLPEKSTQLPSWQGLLAGPHLSFGYAAPVPLAALGAWLKLGEGCALEGSARHILLAPLSDGTLALCWQDADGAFLQCSTGLEASLHLDPILEDLTSNSACFAFSEAGLPAAVDPYTLITSQDPRLPVYQSGNPVPLSDAGQVSRLLSALAFGDLNRASGSGGCVIYVDGDDTLRLYPDGTVRCHANQGRYRAGPDLARAVCAAWDLAGAALGPLCGEGRLYLLSAGEEGGGYAVRFGYSLNGSAVDLPNQDWCAQFIVQDGWITDFTLCLRAYTASGDQALLLPARSAAAILDTLTSETRELVIRYQDNGETAVPGWVGQG